MPMYNNITPFTNIMLTQETRYKITCCMIPLVFNSKQALAIRTVIILGKNSKAAMREITKEEFDTL